MMRALAHVQGALQRVRTEALPSAPVKTEAVDDRTSEVKRPYLDSPQTEANDPEAKTPLIKP